jgi:hypothetical protein
MPVARLGVGLHLNPVQILARQKSLGVNDGQLQKYDPLGPPNGLS